MTWPTKKWHSKNRLPIAPIYLHTIFSVLLTQWQNKDLQNLPYKSKWVGGGNPLIPYDCHLLAVASKRAKVAFDPRRIIRLQLFQCRIIDVSVHAGICGVASEVIIVSSDCTVLDSRVTQCCVSNGWNAGAG